MEEEGLTQESAVQNQNETNGANEASSAGGFEIPQAYKEEGWAQNVKSYDDLWKMNANAQKLIGKKTIGVPDETASEAAWEEFYDKIRPAGADKYAFEGLEPEEAEVFGQMFYKAGLSQKQAQEVMNGYAGLLQEEVNSHLTKEGYENQMKTRFGEDYEKVASRVNQFIRREADKNDLAVLETMPNEVIGLVYGLIDKVQTRYAVNETDFAKQGAGISKEPDFAGFAKEASLLRTKPHTTADLQALKSKYNIP